jgi:integrase
MATIKKRGSSWFVQVRRQGVTKCASFSTKSAANAWATHTESEILSGKRRASTGKTLKEALERYEREVTPTKKGQPQELHRIKHLKALPFAEYKLEDVTTPILAAWRDERLKVIAANTFMREISIISSVYEQAKQEWHWATHNPAKDVKKPTQPTNRQRTLSDQEISKIMRYFGLDDNLETITLRQNIAMAVLFAVETAMRRSEILGLTWDRINLKSRVVTLPKTKNGDARQVPLSTKAVTILQRLEHLSKPFDLNKGTVSILFTRACVESGIEDANFHDLRHSAITRLAKKLTPWELCRSVGHRDMKSTLIYYNEKAENIAMKLD